MRVAHACRTSVTRSGTRGAADTPSVCLMGSTGRPLTAWFKTQGPVRRSAKSTVRIVIPFGFLPIPAACSQPVHVRQKHQAQRLVKARELCVVRSQKDVVRSAKDEILCDPSREASKCGKGGVSPGTMHDHWRRPPWNERYPSGEKVSRVTRSPTRRRAREFFRHFLAFQIPGPSRSLPPWRSPSHIGSGRVRGCEIALPPQSLIFEPDPSEYSIQLATLEMLLRASPRAAPSHTNALFQIA